MPTAFLPATSNICTPQARTRLTIEVDRAGTAQRGTAAEFGPGQTEFVAQEPHERHRGVASNCRSCPFIWTLTVVSSSQRV
jgi:hypothetical protein